MADQQRDQKAGAQETGAERTVVIPAWTWPRTGRDVAQDEPTAPYRPLPGEHDGRGGPGGRDRPDGPGRYDGHDAPTVAVPRAVPPERTLGALVRDWPGLLAWLRRAARRPSRRALVVAGVVIGALALLYGVDLALASGELPRGITIAGVSVGGLDRAAAEARLRQELGPHVRQPVPVSAGDAKATIDPAAAGLDLDWAGTLDRAGAQPLNPLTRLRSLFTSREAGTVTSTDRPKLAAAVQALAARTDHDPVEGTIRFDGITPVPVDPRPGQRLDQPRAIEAVLAGWASGRTLALPVTHTPVRSTPDDVQTALEGFAKPAVAGPVRVTGEGADATLTPDVVATALTFETAPDGALVPKLDNGKITDALRPQLARTEQPGKDATIVIEGGVPTVKPSVDGRGIDWDKSLQPMPDVLRGAGNRTLTAVYVHQPAKFTTEQAGGLGIREVIGEFTTGGFAADSGVNIRTIAAKADGALIKPGETFSLNKYTEPRDAAQGYVEAGIIDKGRPGRAIGGGCSQFATTLYNASYFAGMSDVTHKEHSFYISRYPEAREATVFEGLIDLAFRNDAPTGALIQSIWTPTSITVKIWGTKNYEVESITGARSNFTEPEPVTIPFGEKCTPSNGAQGFTVSNTRVIRDAHSHAELKRTTRTVTYNPSPKIVCTTAPPPPTG